MRKRQKPYPTMQDMIDVLELPDGRIVNRDGSEIETDIEEFDDGKLVVTINGVPMIYSTEEMRAAIRQMIKDDPKFAADMALLKAMHGHKI